MIIMIMTIKHVKIIDDCIFSFDEVEKVFRHCRWNDFLAFSVHGSSPLFLPLS